MINYVVYETTGKILRSGTAPNERLASLQSNEGELVIVNTNQDIHPNTHKVNIATHQIEPKSQIGYVISKSIIQSNGIDTTVISGLPEGTSVRYDGVEYQIDVAGVVFSSDLAGVYTLTLIHPCYLDTLVEVTVA